MESRRVFGVLLMVGLLFTGCKKDDCQCSTITLVQSSLGKVYAKNNCGGNVNDFDIPTGKISIYHEGDVVCSDPNIVW